METSDGKVTKLLADWREGDVTALEKLMPLVLDDLRRIARGFMAREVNHHTLQPTALINEVYILLCGQRKASWGTRAEFFAFAGHLMRRILLNHARAQRAQKRGQESLRVNFDDSISLPPRREAEFIALDKALSSLAAVDPRQARIVELHAFLGLTNEEISSALEISPTTVKRDWSTAKRFLRQKLA